MQSYQIIKVRKSSQKILFIAKSYKVLFAWFKWWNPQDSPMAFKFCDPGAHITYLMILYLPWQQQSVSVEHKILMMKCTLFSTNVDVFWWLFRRVKFKSAVLIEPFYVFVRILKKSKHKIAFVFWLLRN